MLNEPDLQNLARSIVGKRMPSVRLDDVLTENAISSEGEAALRITLVLTPETVNSMSGGEALKLLLDIRHGLEREGDDRLPIVVYATADDFTEVDE
jgi:hypothetical protein